MALAIRKKGQGYWTRTMSAVAVGVLTLMGVAWLWDVLAGVRLPGLEQPVYTQGLASIMIVTVVGLLGFYYIGRNDRFVDFLVATEGEMKKVNWSSRREILGMTWVVIGLTIFIAIFCFVFDFVFAQFFAMINVLDT